MNDKNKNILIPLIAIFLGFLSGVIIMVITGQDPSVLFKSIIRAVTGINIDRIGSSKGFFTPRMLGEYFVYAMPIILTGLSVAFAFRTGLFNIGAEGQVMVGAMVSAILGVLIDLPAILLLPIVVCGGTLAGAIWGYIAGFLKAKYNVHEVVVTIMLNYTAMYMSAMFLKMLPGSTSVKTVDIHSGGLLQSEFLKNLTSGSRLHFGFLLVIFSIYIFNYIINKTNYGYELKAVGYNPFAAEYAGMKVKERAAQSMAIAGAFSGLAGVLLVSGTFGYGRVLLAFENYGFDGIAVALIGGNTALGSLFGGLLLAALKAAQPLMGAKNVPDAIAVIISSMIIIFIAMRAGILDILEKIKGGKK